MYITMDIEDYSLNRDLVSVTFYMNNERHIRRVGNFDIPKYQAVSIQRALKEADPKQYPKATLSFIYGGKDERSRADTTTP